MLYNLWTASKWVKPVDATLAFPNCSPAAEQLQSGSSHFEISGCQAGRSKQPSNICPSSWWLKIKKTIRDTQVLIRTFVLVTFYTCQRYRLQRGSAHLTGFKVGQGCGSREMHLPALKQVGHVAKQFITYPSTQLPYRPNHQFTPSSICPFLIQ